MITTRIIDHDYHNSVKTIIDMEGKNSNAFILPSEKGNVVRFAEQRQLSLQDQCNELADTICA